MAAGDVCPFVEWNFITFTDGLITMAHRGARNLAARVFNSPFVDHVSPTPGNSGIVGTTHIARAQCRLSGSTAGRARMFVRGHNKINGLAEVASLTIQGSASVGTWTDLSVSWVHVPHNNPKLPDALTSLLLLDHNGFGTCEWRNVTVEVPPL